MEDSWEGWVFIIVIDSLGDAKVCELEEIAWLAHCAGEEDENVVGLDVSVDDCWILRVDVKECFSHLVGHALRQCYMLILGNVTVDAL
jgi:hypothetical protein